MATSAIFTKNFGVTNAENFERLTTGVFANTYLAIGRSYPWPNSDTLTAPTDTANSFYQFWNDLIGLKKITAADMNPVIPRVDWVNGTTYTAYTQDMQLFLKASDAAIQYSSPFYVRNNRDQVFKCLSNNFSNVSTTMPEISVAGQLPENPYVKTADGYKWKYMYTIPNGLKERFFTNEFMPITDDPVVTNSAVDGRIDILNISTAGAGYNANVSANSLTIFTIVGDGANANITAKVTSTVAANGANITDYNIINGGFGYTRALVSIIDNQKIAGTANANVTIVIGPAGGHGSSVAEELGASNLMISVGIDGEEGGVLPLSTTQVNSFRQVALIKDPMVKDANTNGYKYADGSIYNTTYKYLITTPNKQFQHNEIVYVGASYATATFTGIVQYYDSGSAYVYLTSISGSFSTPATLNGVSSGALATILSVTTPEVKPYSGKVLYIENSSQITRTLTETQQLKLTLRF